MTAPRPLKNPHAVSDYGPEYETLLQNAYKSPTPWAINCQTSTVAKAFRLKIYAYMRALRYENLRLDLIEKADSLSVVASGPLVQLIRKADTWDHQLIRQNLSEAGVSITPETPEILGTRLGKKLEELRQRAEGGSKMVEPLKTVDFK